jgi:hypothetical protein
MEIIIPETIESGELKILPAGPAKLALTKMSCKASKTSGNPTIYAVFTVMEELANNPEGAPPTVGEKVMDTFSLQANAIWKLNDLYKAVMGDRIPMGTWSTEEEFMVIINDALLNTSWDAMLLVELDQEGKEKMKIDQLQYIDS